MTLRFRLFLWLLLALGLLLIPLAVLTVQQAQSAVQSTLEQALLPRLAFLQSQSGGKPVPLERVQELVQEFGGVGFVFNQGTYSFTSRGDYLPPEDLASTIALGISYREVLGNTLWVAVPREAGGEVRGAVGLAVPLLEVSALPRRLLRLYLWVGGGLGLLAFAVGAWGLSLSLRPLEAVSQELARRGPENLEPLPAPGLLEARPAVEALNTLMRELNTALSRLKVQEQAARRFAYGASHELRNPLAALKGYLEVLQRRPSEVRALSGALRELGRMEALLEGLLTLARLEGQGRVEARSLELSEFLPALWEGPLEGQGTVRADPALLRIAVENLLGNALRHGGGATRLVLEPEGKGVWLWVYDQGPGFSPGMLERAFEPFVKHSDSSGVGLGLALVGALAQALGGKAQAENPPEGGARVGLWLPSA
ncbi:MAG: HAMP domain-containing histidine kinase [Thermaceae bacterium]|nr:HAMP domain-containing histidine kinase [Thermaceae bacterium]